MRRTAIAALSMCLAAPALALPPAAPTPVPAPATPAAPVRPDPARLAAAERLVAVTMPPGYMRETIAELLPNADTILAAFAERFGIDTTHMSREQRIRAVEERGVTQDRHFRERLNITLQVTTRLIGEILDEIEPDLRRVMATLIARQFTVEEIGQMSAFFSTSIGERWTRMSLTIASDPAYQEVLTMMGPRMLAAQQRFDAAVNAATAHLDPVPQS